MSPQQANSHNAEIQPNISGYKYIFRCSQISPTKHSVSRKLYGKKQINLKLIHVIWRLSETFITPRRVSETMICIHQTLLASGTFWVENRW